MTSRYSILWEQYDDCTRLVWGLREISFNKNYIFMRKLEETRATREESWHLGINIKKGAEWVTSASTHHNPYIPLSLVELLHMSTNFLFLHLILITSIAFTSGCVFIYRLWSVCGAPLGVDGTGMYTCLLPEAERDVRLKNLMFFSVCLRVEGEDALVVSAHQQDGWQLLGQCLQPGHVESTGHCSLSGQRKASAQRKCKRKDNQWRCTYFGHLHIDHFDLGYTRIGLPAAMIKINWICLKVFTDAVFTLCLKHCFSSWPAS